MSYFYFKLFGFIGTGLSYVAKADPELDSHFLSSHRALLA